MSNNKYIQMVATITGNYTMPPVILATVSYQLRVRGHSILPAACNKLLPAILWQVTVFYQSSTCDRSQYLTSYVWQVTLSYQVHRTGHSILPAVCDRSHYFTSYVWQVIVSYQLCMTGSHYLTSYVYCLVVFDGLAPIVTIQRDSSVTLGVLLHLLLPRHIFHPVRQRRAITEDDHKHKAQAHPRSHHVLSPRWGIDRRGRN